MTETYCSAMVPNVCRLFDATAHETGLGPVCEGCYRYLHKRDKPAPRRPGGSRGAPAHVRRRVLAHDEHRCQLRYPGCVGTATEVDHVVNVAAILRAGGTRQQADSEANLQAACSSCHSIKSERERSTALAASNRQRAAARRARLRRPVEPHPGD